MSFIILALKVALAVAVGIVALRVLIPIIWLALLAAFGLLAAGAVAGLVFLFAVWEFFSPLPILVTGDEYLLGELWLRSRGFVPAYEHPDFLEIRAKENREWMKEAMERNFIETSPLKKGTEVNESDLRRAFYGDHDA